MLLYVHGKEEKDGCILVWKGMIGKFGLGGKCRLLL